MRDHDKSSEQRLSAERMASLNNSMTPGLEVQERIVGALRDNGVLRDNSSAVRIPSARPVLRSAWMTGLGPIAATLVFITGMKVGEVRASARTGVDHLESGADPRRLAEQLKETATNYFDALSRVEESDALASAVAVQSFGPVADQLVRIAPESSIALAVQAVLPRSNASSARYSVSLAAPSRLIWY